MEELNTENQSCTKEKQVIQEGSAIVKTSGNVFYNPVQEFNRDLSISVLNAFIKNYIQLKNNNEVTATKTLDVEHNNDVTVLEALSATGLRSIRYAKEVAGIKQIVANEISRKAVVDIEQNIIENKLQHLVTANCSDAVMLMYEHRREKQFDIVDLDPYGCPSIFLDSAVQAVKEGGLLLVTATDMAILAGNCPETCYSKYGSISLKLKSCHEMALRILLRCIESHANRYGRYIMPMLSISADFYIRVFVRIFSGARKCKYTLSKLSNVYQCTGCDSFTLQPLGIIKRNDITNSDKFSLPTMSLTSNTCEHCSHPLKIGGPIWTAPIHSMHFVRQVLESTSKNLSTYRRIEGTLNVILEELEDCPLYYTLDKLIGTLHIESPSMQVFRSALLNAGYRVSYSHCNKISIKTNAPGQVVWDVMRCWQMSHPVSERRLIDGTPVKSILSIKPETNCSFELHPGANPISKRKGFVRFQQNPAPFWGPGTRATSMTDENKLSKSKQNQGKRKRNDMEDVD